MQVVHQVAVVLRWVEATGLADTIQLGIWIYLFIDRVYMQFNR
jgi:hypothetical protein